MAERDEATTAVWELARINRAQMSNILLIKDVLYTL